MKSLSDVIDFVITNIKEVILSCPQKTSLNYAPWSIWLYVLNAKEYKLKDSADDIIFFHFYQNCGEYLPIDLQNLADVSDKQFFIHNITPEKIRAFNVWFGCAITKLAMKISGEYYDTGLKRYIDILEKRHRKLWGPEPKTTEVNVGKETDNNMTIVIKEV